MTPSAVNEAARELGIDVLTPASLRRPAALDPVLEHLEAAAVEVLVVVAYGLILPPRLLDLLPYGCINVHASILPRWRGAAPIERAMLAGDARTGVSIMAMDEGLDTGPVYAVRETPIEPTDTGDRLHERLAALGAGLLLEVLTDLPARTPVAQPEEGVCYAPKLEPHEARLDWHQPAADLALKIRAFNSRMPAFGLLDGERVRLLLATAAAGDGAHPPGTIIAAERDGLRIATGAGVLCVSQLQLTRGKGRVLTAAEALNGHAELLAAGRRFDA
jgi:methionyl-tRNA formyltransferase